MGRDRSVTAPDANGLEEAVKLLEDIMRPRTAPPGAAGRGRGLPLAVRRTVHSALCTAAPLILSFASGVIRAAADYHFPFPVVAERTRMDIQHMAMPQRHFLHPHRLHRRCRRFRRF